MINKIVPIILLLLFVGCSSDETTVKDTALETKVVEKVVEKKENSSNKKEALFTLETLEGKTLHIDEKEAGLKIHEFKDKVVFLLFFGHQCPPCLAEIPSLVALTKEAHKDLEIIALEVQGLEDESLKNFAKNKNINYNLVSGNKNQDLIGYVAQKAGWSGGIPFLLAMDKNGTVQVVHTGGLAKAQFDNIYNELKKETVVKQ